MHAKNADMYPVQYTSLKKSGGQNLPGGGTMSAEPVLTTPFEIKQDATKPELSGFKMVMNQNSRMGGSVPVWTPAKDEINTDEKPSEDFGFMDLVDMINPLQHIPFVGQIYRAITGDIIKPAAEIIGGALFGGPVGAGVGAASAIAGDDIKQAFASMMSDDRDTTIAITNLRSPERYNN